MKHLNVLFGLACSCALVACAPLPEVSAIPVTVAPSMQKVDARLGEVRVLIASVDEQQGYMPPNAAAIAPVWRAGVVDALGRSGVFQAGSTRQLDVEVKIIKLDSLQNNDLSTTTTVIASYRVVDAATQEVTWIRGISSSSTVAYKEAMAVTSRERISLNAAVQNNIAQFVQLYGNGQTDYTAVPQGEFRLRQTK